MIEADSEILFQEKQKFKRYWTWAFALVSIIIFMATLSPFFAQQSFHPTAGHIIIMVSSWLILLILSIILVITKLETIVIKDALFVRFYPYHIKYKKIPFSTISQAYIRSYSPIWEYGGWGIRFSISGKGKAYITSGHKGLQIELKDGKKLLISTQNPMALEYSLKQAGIILY